jgi:hypothetical protein
MSIAIQDRQFHTNGHTAPASSLPPFTHTLTWHDATTGIAHSTTLQARTLEDLWGHVRTIVGMVKTYKAQQPAPDKSANFADSKTTPPTTGLPKCELHGATLQRFEREGRTWHSHKLADGSWCKGKGKTA